MKHSAIKIFITGGTMDDLEYELLKDAPCNPQTYIPGKLNTARLTIKYSTEVLIMKDSRHITSEDRKRIHKKCQNCKEDKIIITHGTATMPNTAKYLGQQVQEKTIVLVGSAIPINKKGSDAFFNLGTAIAAVQLLPKGIYITMNGRIFTWDNVKKNFDKGIFETEQ